MATVIDALLVSLGLDASSFEKNAGKVLDTQDKIKNKAKESTAAVDVQEKKLAEAQAKRGKQLEVRSKEIALGVTKLRNEALKMFAVFTGGVGVKSFFESAINSAAGLGRMSDNLGMSAKDMAMWQLAAKNAGGTAEGMAAHIKQATSDLAAKDMGRGLSDALTASLRYGIKSGDLKDTNTLLMAQADILKKMYAESPAQAMEAAKMMGINEENFNLLKQGSAVVNKLRQENSGLADEMANLSKPAEQIRKDIDSLGNSFNASGLKIVGVFLPAIKAVADELKNFAGFLGDEQAMDQVSSRIAKVLAFFGNKEAKESLAANAKFAAESKKLPFSGGKSTPAQAKPDTPAAGGGKPNVGLPRGMRNNNPGNIEYGPFAKKHGATGSDGRFAIFPTMEAGQAAMQALLGGYLDKGHNTVSKAINRWAPSSENNTAAYVAAVSKQIGVGADQQLNSSHLPALAEAISRHENGAAWGRRNAEAAANMPMGAAAAQGASRGGGASKTEVTVGQITVNTQATDAQGIARSITGALNSQYSLAAQANTGLA